MEQNRLKELTDAVAAASRHHTECLQLANMTLRTHRQACAAADEALAHCNAAEIALLTYLRERE